MFSQSNMNPYYCLKDSNIRIPNTMLQDRSKLTQIANHHLILLNIENVIILNFFKNLNADEKRHLRVRFRNDSKLPTYSKLLIDTRNGEQKLVD